MAKKVTNRTHGPKGAYLKGVYVEAAPGETIEADDFCKEWFVSPGRFNAHEDDDIELTLDGRISEAVAAFDGDEDSNWTGEGLPSVEAVSKALGVAVTRKQIDAATDVRRPDPEPV